MRDHQLFEKQVLRNGISVYTYVDDFPISCVEVQLPFGVAHATKENGLVPGSPHFLEHVQLIRSQKFPKPYSLDRLLGQHAGSSNGETSAKTTTHWIDVPSTAEGLAIELLIDRVFHPLFHEDDIAIERGVIRNERDQNKFYPGRDLESQHYFLNFIKDDFYPQEQIFGNDADLDALTIPRLQELHNLVSSSNETRVLAVGQGPFEGLIEALERLPTQTIELGHSITPTSWAQKEYHEVFLPSTSQPRLEIAWINDRPTYEEFCGVHFILNLLINTTQGALFQEFREEKGWTYGLGSTLVLREHNLISGISFPVNHSDHIAYIREHITGLIRAAVNSQQFVEQEVTRQIGNQVYYYQTAGSIINRASDNLIQFGRIHTQEEFNNALKKMQDPTWRNYLLATFFNADEMGSMSFLPPK